MKKMIWKFPLNKVSDTEISMPIGAELLTIQTQNDIPILWALVDDIDTTEIVMIEAFYTGEGVGYDMGTSREYINTIQLNNGIVIHYFKYTGV